MQLRLIFQFKRYENTCSGILSNLAKISLHNCKKGYILQCNIANNFFTFVSTIVLCEKCLINKMLVGPRLPVNRLSKVVSSKNTFDQLKSSSLKVIAMDDVETGPILSSKKRELIQDFVTTNGGKRVIQRILIANNGMAATKAILSMKNWAYMNLGDESAIEFVVMATKDDLNANAEFIRLADAFVEVPSGSNKVTFLIKSTLMK